MKKKFLPVYVGMDVAKATLQVHLQNRQIQFGNHAAGHALLCKELGRFPTAQVVCEATGGYEYAVARAFAAANIPVSIVNPAQVRHTARAQGNRAKTDPLDAALLTDYGQRFQPLPTPPVLEVQRQLEELTLWLTQTIQARAIAKTQAEHQSNPFVRAQHQKLLEHYTQQIQTVEAEIQKLIEQDQMLAQRVQCLAQIVGVGQRTAWLVLANLPELGKLNRQQVAALAGLAPWPTDSGEVKGIRHIRGGRHEARRVLYMPALCAARANPVLKVFYEGLIQRNKPAKVALTAVMRKLLIHMNNEMKKTANKPCKIITPKRQKTKKSLAK